MQVEPLAVAPGGAATGILPRLAEALAGGRPVAPHAASGPIPDLHSAEPRDLPDDLAVVVGTSGSTGPPKLALLTTAALRASVRATHDRLGGPGQWLLALPAHHVGGLQVLLRSLAAGTSPVPLPAGGFTASAFAATAALLEPGVRHYTALVPTQLGRLLEDPAGVRALGAFDAVLVGGAATPHRLRHRVHEAGVQVVPTYGSSETAGGCVYAGRPLDGVRVVLDPDGRVRLGGATVAHGYLGRPELTEAAFHIDADGTRWFRTDDVGRLDADGVLHVDGRVDDVIVTGGLKVAPRVVEDAVAAVAPEVRDVLAVGLPDPEWGQVVGVLVVLDPDAADGPVAGGGSDAARGRLTGAELRARLRGTVPAHVLPRRVRTIAALPGRGPGKPDRTAAVVLLTGVPDSQ
ncbi:MAG: o-succinylbenzoate--CoA ligase [Dermatophilaceae bacterium]